MCRKLFKTGLCKDDGKETTILYRVIYGLCRGYIGLMEKNMETTMARVLRGEVFRSNLVVAWGPVLHESRESNKHWAFVAMERLVAVCLQSRGFGHKGARGFYHLACRISGLQLRLYGLHPKFQVPSPKP